MKTLEEIQSAIEALPHEECMKLGRRLAERDWIACDG